MDDLLTYLKDHCTTAETLNDIHAIIHADDTILLSTDRDKFIIKCNKATNFITINRLKVNFGKSSFVVINSKGIRDQMNIKIDNGILKCVHDFVYLGVIISDTGSVKEDVKRYLDRKRANVMIKSRQSRCSLICKI